MKSKMINDFNEYLKYLKKNKIKISRIPLSSLKVTDKELNSSFKLHKRKIIQD
jgi:hypothetical protein